ncbi:MAG: hypothetical protein AB1629_05635 [Candidatus Omnitrophota bacterium]
MVIRHFYIKAVSILFLVSFFSGCSTLAVKRDESKSVRLYSYSYDEVWKNLIEEISKIGDTIKLQNKEKGIILTGYDSISLKELKRIANMPPLAISSGMAGAWLYARNKVDYSIKSVSPVETQVKITVYLQGYNASGQRWINIFTNGTKEKEAFDELQTRLEKSN